MRGLHAVGIRWLKRGSNPAGLDRSGPTCPFVAYVSAGARWYNTAIGIFLRLV